MQPLGVFVNVLECPDGDPFFLFPGEQTYVLLGPVEVKTGDGFPVVVVKEDGAIRLGVRITIRSALVSVRTMALIMW